MEKTYKREFESRESQFVVLAKGNEVQFLKSDYNEDYELSQKQCFIVIMNSEMGTRGWCEFIEAKFNVTNCYDLNDWRVA